MPHSQERKGQGHASTIRRVNQGHESEEASESEVKKSGWVRNMLPRAHLCQALKQSGVARECQGTRYAPADHTRSTMPAGCEGLRPACRQAQCLTCSSNLQPAPEWRQRPTHKQNKPSHLTRHLCDVAFGAHKPGTQHKRSPHTSLRPVTDITLCPHACHSNKLVTSSACAVTNAQSTSSQPINCSSNRCSTRPHHPPYSPFAASCSPTATRVKGAKESRTCVTVKTIRTHASRSVLYRTSQPRHTQHRPLPVCW